MITGFNTDIEYQGVTYHVQTEDKGLNTPLILSLIYQGGTILASRRSPYAELLSDGTFTEKILQDRLQRQHKLICAAIRAGRIEDLKRMMVKDSPESDKPAISAPDMVQAESSISSEKQAEPQKRIDGLGSADRDPHGLLVINERNVMVERPRNADGSQLLGRIPKPSDTLGFDLPEVTAEHVIEEVVIIEEEMILPADAVVILSENLHNKPPADNSLRISLLNERDLKSGERKTISLFVGRGEAKIGLPKAHVVVKVLGSTFRPLIFHAKTDGSGVAVLNVNLPNFKTGRAVLFVRAMHEGEECEFRRVIAHG